MTKPVDPKKSRNYIIKAENSLRIAKIAIEYNAYDNAVMTAIHSAINALDALTSSEKGFRASGEHDEVLTLLKGILTPNECADIEKQFSSLIDLKNTAEYQPDFMSPEEARNSIKRAQRILDKVKAKMKTRKDG